MDHHKPEKVIENKQETIFWDYNIQIDRIFEAIRPNIKRRTKENQKMPPHRCDYLIFYWILWLKMYNA